MAKRKVQAVAKRWARFRQEPFRFVVHLFSEGDTESVYLQHLAKPHNVLVREEDVVSSPVVLLDKAFHWAIKNAKLLRKEDGRHLIWVVFDDDAKARDMAEVEDAWNKCPELCMKTCRVRDRNRCDYADVLKLIHVAFMTPCFELWGLMCTEKQGVRRKKEYSLDRHTLQRELKKRMPNYDHDGHPYFDLGKMVATQEACAIAESWVKTYGEFPMCMKASRFAGIAPLVNKIMACELPRSPA